MAIFNIQKQKLSLIKEKPISLEKDIQKLTEGNLETIFGLRFISTEFPVQDFRIDTLAFDEETRSFVIIEYKRNRSSSVIDQGFSYLAAMLNNKADFILEYNEKTKEKLGRKDVDWSQSKVLFLAQRFTTYQKNAINFRDLAIELWEVKAYNNSTILYNQLLASDAKESIKTTSKNKTTIASVSKEIKVYTLDDHLEKTTERIKNLFLTLREKLLEFDDNIEEKPTKLYISYRTQSSFASIVLQKKDIKIYLSISQKRLNDPKQVSADVTDVGRWPTGETTTSLNKQEDLPYILTLIEQAYQAAK